MEYSLLSLPNQWLQYSESKCSNLSVLLKQLWDRLHNESEVFRYKIISQRERRLIGRYKYLLQLNPDRASKRRQPVLINNILQDFNPKSFNFTSVSPQEKIMSIRNTDKSARSGVLLVNVSPISRYHSLLCPSVEECLPQVVTEDSLNLALEVMYLAQDRQVRIGFNSLCAMASVNHLHYHVLLEASVLPVEHIKCEHVAGPVFTFEEDYPAPGFCLEVKTKHDIEKTARSLYKLLSYFLDRNIAHNLLITCGEPLTSGTLAAEVVRVAVWPRKSSAGAKQLDAFNVAVCELSGWFPVYDEADFESLTTIQVEEELRRWAYEPFLELRESVRELFV